MDEPILPELPAPPVERIAVRGAQRLRVLNVDSPNPGSRGGFTECVALAWARLPDGDWAALLAWLSGWRGEDGRTTGRGRFGWYRVLEDRTKAMPIWPHRDPDVEWHGYHADDEIAVAMREAAATLPEQLREAALTPRPGAEP